MGYKILLTEEIGNEGREFLIKNGYEIKLAKSTAEEDIIAELKDCDGMIVRLANITEKIIASTNSLKVIGKFGVGVDNIDVKAATKFGVQVTNSRESNMNTVAEYTIGLILALSKRFFLYDEEIKKGNYEVRQNLGIDLQGKTLGIIGAGNIGKLVCEKAINGFGMKVIQYKRRVSEKDKNNCEYTTDLELLLKKSDFISLHVPLTEETRNMIGKKQLALMKKDAFLINTARGEVINTEELVEALKSGKIAGAAIDVFEGEIPSKDNPLLKLKNVILSPHTAAHTVEAFARMSLHPAIGVHEVLTGKKPSWPVNHVI